MKFGGTKCSEDHQEALMNEIKNNRDKLKQSKKIEALKSAQQQFSFLLTQSITDHTSFVAMHSLALPCV